MCPACIANIAIIAAGATSGGGVATFVLSKFYRSNKQIKTEDNQNENQKSLKEKGRIESAQNRLLAGSSVKPNQLPIVRPSQTGLANCREVAH
jgi:hypothetical protein